MRRSVIGVLGAAGLAALAAYPRPALLVRTLRHARRPDVDPEAVRELAQQLPDDPDLVRTCVHSRLMPYAYEERGVAGPTQGSPSRPDVDFSAG